MILVAIDPGRDTGWAVFMDGKLKSCGHGDPPFDNIPRPTDVVIEKPQTYHGRASRGDTNDLITLAIQVGRYVERSKGIVHLPTPADWKGQVKKEVHHPRILALLSAAERTVLAAGAKRPRAKNLNHNVVDAVGIGLWHLGRLAR